MHEFRQKEQHGGSGIGSGDKMVCEIVTGTLTRTVPREVSVSRNCCTTLTAALRLAQHRLTVLVEQLAGFSEPPACG